MQDCIHIDTPPGRIWSWLTRLSEHYTRWHPDHVSADWERGEPNQIGSVLRAVEYLGGHREQLRFEMIDVDPPRRMEYRIRGLHSLLLPGGSFEIAPDGEGSKFTAGIRYRFGPLTERILKHRVAALRTHMREEGQNLKRLLETAA
jgi:uncharacterized protein YndB with AHSA1/START domain